MHSTVAAPFTHSLELLNFPWLTLYVADNRHSFTIVPHNVRRQNWCDRKFARTSLLKWRRYRQQAIQAVQQTQHGRLVVVFPQLAAVEIFLINILLLLPNEATTAAKQVTIVEAMRMRRALIETRCTDAEGYVQHGMVELSAIEPLLDAIQLH